MLIGIFLYFLSKWQFLRLWLYLVISISSPFFTDLCHPTFKWICKILVKSKLVTQRRFSYLIFCIIAMLPLWLSSKVLRRILECLYLYFATFWDKLMQILQWVSEFLNEKYNVLSSVYLQFSRKISVYFYKWMPELYEMQL